MKKFLLCVVGLLFTLFVIIYLAFIFYLPKVLDLNIYLPEVQKMVKDETNIDLFIINPRISTNYLLQAGVEADKIVVKLPDGSVLMDTNDAKIRVSLPNLLFLTIKISCIQVDDLKVNLEIENGEQFKIVRLVENILNKKKDVEHKEPTNSAFDLSRIKIKIPSAKVTNYSFLINDKKNRHYLNLRGDLLKFGYNDGKTFKLKTNAEFLSDNRNNILFNLDIDSFIPPAKEKDPDDDPAEKIELPFINPVLVYRDYDLKSNVDIKAKLRTDKHGKLLAKGYADIKNLTMNLSGLQLPYSYLKAKFLGNSVVLDTSIGVTKNQTIGLKGKMSIGKNPFINMNFFTDKIYFNDLIILSKAFLDTLHIQNNLTYLKASGYVVGKGRIKSDFKTIQSAGSIIARDGYVSNGKTHLVFDKINANLIFDGNTIKIVDTRTLINGGILKAEGKIDADSYSDISIHSEHLPLKGLFLAFAPSNLKRSISLNTGTLSIDSKLQGNLKNLVAYANVILDNLEIQNDNFKINNERVVAGIVTDTKSIDGSISNKNFNFSVPKTLSVIHNPNLLIKLNGKDISILPASIFINKLSKIDIVGNIRDYHTLSNMSLKADGLFHAADLKQFLGKEAEPFVAAIGDLPIKAKLSGTDKKQEIVLQVKSDSKNYITPIDIDSMVGKQSIMQAKIYNKKDGLQIRKTGLYTNIEEFSDDLESNLSNAKSIVEVSGTIVNTNTSNPFINRLKFDIADNLKGKISAFGHSSFNLSGHLLVFGKAVSPVMRGNFKLSDLSIPEIYTSMESADISLLNKDIDVGIRRLILNGSDLNIDLKTDINPHSVFTIANLNIFSHMINIDTILKVVESLDKYLVKSDNSANESSDIPLLISNGNIRLDNLKTGNILLENARGKISLMNNNLFLNKLDASVFNGKVYGDIVTNIKEMFAHVVINGENWDVEKTLLDSASVKDALQGTMEIATDLTIDFKNPDNILKNIAGSVVLNIIDGQLGPFGKLENMILAENIRESQFFKTALGGVINNLATIDTTHFKTLDGLIMFDNGIAKIIPVTTIGNVMSLHIAGDYDLINNTADMKVRAKLGSAIANMLGPISQLNPINLVQVTPGLNVVMAKTFFLFCEQLTPDETAALPKLESDFDDRMATKFQIILKGDVAKPLTLVKSFKWLALASEIDRAKGFVDSLPDPSIVEDSQNATIEEIIKAQENKAKEDAKLINRVRRFFASKI